MLKKDLDELVDVKKFQRLRETAIVWLNEGVPARIKDKNKVYFELSAVRSELLAFNMELFDKYSSKNAVCNIFINYMIETDKLIVALSERAQEMYREYNSDRLLLEIKDDDNEEE